MHSASFSLGKHTKVNRQVFDDRLNPVPRPRDGGQQQDAPRLLPRTLWGRRMWSALAEWKHRNEANRDRRWRRCDAGLGIVVQLQCYLDAVTMLDRFVEAFLDKFPLKPCCGFEARRR
jgi:hypothetical protein